MSRVERFSDAGDTVPCPGLRFEADPLGPDEVAISVPRTCVGKPGAIRAAMRATFEDRVDNARDVAPAEHAFFGKVKR